MTYQPLQKEKDRIKVLVVDDHPIVRFGLINFIDNDKDFCVCGEADNAHNALQAIQESAPDVAIIDIRLKGQSGIELIKNIKVRYPDLPVIALSMYDESVYAERLICAGAKGYIMKQEGCERVIEGLHQVVDGGIYVSDKIRSKMERNKYIEKKNRMYESPLDILSDRELEVFRLIGQGYGTRQIAKELFLGIKTIETYRAHIKSKLQLKDSSELVRYAIRWGQGKLCS
jgi:DNA-binding NarL/FixJ family response regulator